MKPLVWTIVAMLAATLSHAGTEVRWECLKNFGMTSHGEGRVVEGYLGTVYIRSQEDGQICESWEAGENHCGWRYTVVTEGKEAIIGFLRYESSPQDTQVIVLDLLNNFYYRTVRQGELRLTQFGECQDEGSEDLEPPLRYAAIEVLFAAYEVPTTLDYCEERSSREDQYRSAFAAWDERNSEVIDQALRVLSDEGGWRDGELDTLRRAVESVVELQLVPLEESCATALREVQEGSRDLTRRQDIQESVRRVLQERE